MLSRKASVVIVAVLVFCWLVLVWGVVAYAVFWLGHSGWWFLLPALLSKVSVKINPEN